MQQYDNLLCNCMQRFWLLLPSVFLSVKWVLFSEGCCDNSVTLFPGWPTAVINRTAP